MKERSGFVKGAAGGVLLALLIVFGTTTIGIGTAGASRSLVNERATTTVTETASATHTSSSQSNSTQPSSASGLYVASFRNSTTTATAASSSQPQSVSSLPTGQSVPKTGISFSSIVLAIAPLVVALVLGLVVYQGSMRRVEAE